MLSLIQNLETKLVHKCIPRNYLKSTWIKVFHYQTSLLYNQRCE